MGTDDSPTAPSLMITRNQQFHQGEPRETMRAAIRHAEATETVDSSRM